MFVDITERYIAEDSLRATRDALAKELAERTRAEERVQQLNERLMSVLEEERSRIARELHDDLSQRLAAISAQLSSIKRDLPDSDAGIREKAERARKSVGEVAKAVRNISHQLHPAVIEYAGLTAALRGHCAGIQRADGNRSNSQC